MKKIVYVDMDNVLVDFSSGVSRLSEDIVKEYEGRLDEVPGIFALMDPVKDAISSFVQLVEKFDMYVLSTSPWKNPTAAQDKITWVKEYLGKHAYKRLILSHHKNLNIGDYLIDDRTKNGADKFQGEHLLFGSEQFPGWKEVLAYLM